MTAIRSLLVANRGEIARRVMRTAHEMGIRTIAVYAEPDRDAPHVGDADLAIGLGDSPRSYLDATELLAAAARSGADAIHPGYGFLAENAEFAEAVVDAGLVWVGPPAEAIRVMGDKVAAKALATDAGVPTLEHAMLEGDEPEAWADAVEPLGYPIVIKATAGGGGKGMYRVDASEDLTDAVESARRVAASAFGNATVFAEKWLATPRHIEIQVFADRAGNAVHLGERECSIQRRHQKILEEAPSPIMTPEMRATMGASAVSLTRSVGYEGAGTVEFLFEGGDFWFLEMNTRLQVEHPVTEEITGIDLVRLQIQVAAGDDLGFDQDDVALSGHAIEVRLYAEDPAGDFLPCVGVLHRYEHATTPGIRYEDGVATGSEVTPLYDPMLAKMIAHAPTRAEAAARLARALSGMHIQGVTTNRDYLVRVLRDDDFLAGATFITYVGDHPALTDADPLDDAPALVGQVLAAALLDRAKRRAADPHWSFAPGGFGRSSQTVTYRWNPDRRDDDLVLAVDYLPETETRFQVRVTATRGESEPELIGDTVVEVVDSEQVEEAAISLAIDDMVRRFDVHVVADRIWVNSSDGQAQFAELPRFRDLAAEEVAGGPTAPMPGTVTSVEVAPGDEVIAGQTLVVLEAMKMEHRITVAAPSVVVEVLVAEGDTVDAHQLLVRLEEADD